MCVDYIIEVLVDSEEFFVISKELVAKNLANEKLDCTGIIPPRVIRRLGEILEVDFIVLGGVDGFDYSVSVHGLAEMEDTAHSRNTFLFGSSC